MKRIITILLVLVSLIVLSEIPPVTKQYIQSPSFYLDPYDSTAWVYMGSAKGWLQLQHQNDTILFGVIEQDSIKFKYSGGEWSLWYWSADTTKKYIDYKIAQIDPANVVNAYMNTFDVISDTIWVTWPVNFSHDKYKNFVSAYIKDTLPDGKISLNSNAIYNYRQTVSGFGCRVYKTEGEFTYYATDTTNMYPILLDSLYNYLAKKDSLIQYVTPTQLKDSLDNFTVTEIDPIYANDSATIKTAVREWDASVAKDITTQDTTYWGEFHLWDKDYDDLTNKPSFADSLAGLVRDTTSINGLTLDENIVLKPSNIEMDTLLGTPTYSTQNDFNNSFGSTGRKTGGIISDATGGYVAVTGGTGFIKATDDDNAQLLPFDWAAPSNIQILSGATKYIGVEYNAGSPQVVAHATYDWDFDTNFPLGAVQNENINGTDYLYVINNPWWVTDGMTNIIQVLRSFGLTRRDESIGGLILSQTGTRNIKVTAGKTWTGLIDYTFDGVDTNISGTVSGYWYKAGTGWQESDITQFSVTQWNDVSQTTLQNIATGKYCNVWVFGELSAATPSIAVVYPQVQYDNEKQAEVVTMPSLLPEHISRYGLLLGRYLIKQGVDTPIFVKTAFNTSSSESGVTSHAYFSDLDWTSTGHTGTPTTIAGFAVTTGAAAEYTLSGTGTELATTNSPSFTTPALGTPSALVVTNASGTASININGTVGATTANTVVGTTIQSNTGLIPDANDGAYIGTTTAQFSDLFLAEGGVINFDNGDATITQVGDVVTIAGADVKITTPGTASTSVATIDGTQTLTNKIYDYSGSLADHAYQGEVDTYTAGENLVIGDLVYFKSDGKVWKSKADAYATARTIGVSTGSISANATGVILKKGKFRDDTWNWTVGASLWLSAGTAGLITETQPATATNQIQYIGQAISADVILFEPSKDIGEK